MALGSPRCGPYLPAFSVGGYTYSSFSMWENSAHLLQPISLFLEDCNHKSKTSWCSLQQTALASCSWRKPGRKAIWRGVCGCTWGSYFPFHTATQLRCGDEAKAESEMSHKVLLTQVLHCGCPLFDSSATPQSGTGTRALSSTEGAD